MRKQLLAASLVFAMAFAISCSSDDGDQPDGTSSPSGGGGTGPSSCVDGTVPIGTQVWQKCNSNDVPRKGVYKCYKDLESNCQKYGKLYDWEAANDVCPSGFHLPTIEDWDALTAYIEVNKNCTNCDAKHLKATSGWNGRGNGLDSYGFSALPGGYGGSYGNFGAVGNFGYWWSASGDSYTAYLRDMYYEREYAAGPVDFKSNLFSVRCLQD